MDGPGQPGPSDGPMAVTGPAAPTAPATLPASPRAPAPGGPGAADDAVEGEFKEV